LVKVKDVQAAMKEAAAQIETLKQIESLVKKEIAEQSTIRAGATEGFIPDL
jgi:capsule polysaccharide export protein KpsE/RkpR